MTSARKSIRVLLVENDRPLKILLERPLDGSNPVMLAIRVGSQASEAFHRQSSDTHTDIELPGLGRIETLQQRSDSEESELLLLTPQVQRKSRPLTEGEQADLEADFARERGHPDRFLTKPLSAAEIGEILDEATHRKAQRQEIVDSEVLAQVAASGDVVLGQSEAMRRLMTIAQRVAAGTASVLIHGETGTGKTVLARQIHALSPRSEGRFVAINCSAFQDQLLESELFGHEKGSFTGAGAPKPGLFEMAHQGTLFLDEVGDMSPAMQAKLLQVLDDGEMRRVGGTKTRKVDVRVLAASNKDLEAEVEAGNFREDLFFRLNVIRLVVPPLSERRDDIVPLIQFFLERFKVPGQAAKTVSPEALQRLVNYSWPGNVRELANSIEGLVLLAPGDEIQASDLPANLRPSFDPEPSEDVQPLPLSDIERLHIARTLDFTEGRKAPAARLLGIDVKTLRNKIRSYGLDP